MTNPTSAHASQSMLSACTEICTPLILRWFALASDDFGAYLSLASDDVSLALIFRNWSQHTNLFFLHPYLSSLNGFSSNKDGGAFLIPENMQLDQVLVTSLTQ